MNWAQTNNFDASDLRALYSNPVVIRKVLHEIAVTGKQVNLQNYEIPAAICLETEYFTSANGLLTPSDKLVRHECEKRYKDKIEELYSMIFEGETKRSTVADELTGILKQVTGNDQLSSGTRLIAP
jgi:long-subunit acyl-CoA synthetase (AMP-forming)